MALKVWWDVWEGDETILYRGCGGNYISWCVQIHRTIYQQLIVLRDNINILKGH